MITLRIWILNFSSNQGAISLRILFPISESWAPVPIGKIRLPGTSISLAGAGRSRRSEEAILISSGDRTATCRLGA